MRVAWLLFVFGLSFGCGQGARTQRGPLLTATSAPAAPGAMAVAPTLAPTTTPEAADPMAAASAAGDWNSESCGARTYERRLHLKADGDFTAEDLVSPCPEGAQCVWSGIETRRGKWKQGSKILLLREEPTVAKMGPSFPLELDWDGRLREGSCEYERVRK